ncbi:MAG: cupredoxin domain-containing protein [Gammaproteobacteria bacterium]
MSKRASVGLAVAWLAVCNGALAAETAEHGAAQPAPHRHHTHRQFTFGEPGKEAEAARTVEVVALDTMRYEPAQVTVKVGETIRFVFKNAGQMPHEAMLGDAAEQHSHGEMMKKHPGMVHDDPNAVSLKPGESKPLVWKFTAPGEVLVGCHVPGHHDAGMVGRIDVLSTGP